MEANQHPLYQYCMGLMEAVNQDVSKNLSPDADTQALIRIAKASVEKVNQLIIPQTTAILLRRKFIAVFRPSDVKALILLRDQMYWKGHAMLFRVAGNHSLYRETFDTLRKHNFSVFSYGALLYPGDIDPENVNPGGLDPIGYVNGFVDEGNRQPNPNNAAYNSGFDQGQIVFNEIVANTENWGGANASHVWDTMKNAGKNHQNTGGSTQVWNDFMKGWNDGVNDAANNAAAGNPLGGSGGGGGGSGSLHSKGVRLFHMDLNNSNHLHRDFNPFRAFPGNPFGKRDGFDYGCPFNSGSWLRVGLNPFCFA